VSDTIIEVQDLSKKYLIGHQMNYSLRESITEQARKIYSTVSRKKLPDPAYEELWSLKDVSFEIKQGDKVAIVGRNGAGKSTLLKILSRITEPTRGKISIKGRVASLLEVGTGFHQELTGRENIYLNGSILGMSKVEIQNKFDEIVAFSEVEKFLDTPVKRYSSGMYVRLAFAVAAHLEPEILVVDEVLAVGDVEFQKKCLGKMNSVSQEGRTVLFVSHNMIAVKNLCQRAIWLDRGQVKEDGNASQVISSYLHSYSSQINEQVWDDIETAPGNEQVRLQRLCAKADTGALSEQITMATPILIEVALWNFVDNANLHVTLHVITEDNITAFTTSADDHDLPVGLYHYACHIPGHFLNSGLYKINVLVVRELTRVIFELEEAISFDVRDMRQQEYGYHEREDGVIAPQLDWEMKRLNQDSLNSWNDTALRSKLS